MQKDREKKEKRGNIERKKVKTRATEGKDQRRQLFEVQNKGKKGTKRLKTELRKRSRIKCHGI